MRATEFLKESNSGTLQNDVAAALPAAYVIPKLQNNDAYSQYRFGVALAAAGGKKARDDEGSRQFTPRSAWGENQIVIAYGNTDEFDSLIDDALEMVGLSPSDKKLISTPTSEESSDVDTVSPLATRK
jgi:hypothetical protein